MNLKRSAVQPGPGALTGKGQVVDNPPRGGQSPEEKGHFLGSLKWQGSKGFLKADRPLHFNDLKRISISYGST